MCLLNRERRTVAKGVKGMRKDVKELKKYLDDQADSKEISSYVITYKEHSYPVHNLMVEVEDGYVMFSDIEGIITNDILHVMNMIDIDFIENIFINDCEINIMLKSGNIKIKVEG